MIFNRDDVAPLLLTMVRELEESSRFHRERLPIWRDELRRDLDSTDIVGERTLTPTNKEDFHRRSSSQFRSNFIPVNNDYIIARFIRADMRISVSEPGSPDEEERASHTERFLHGVLRTWGRQQAEQGGVGDWLRDAVSWGLSGEVIVHPQVTSRAGTLEVRCKFLDPMGTYYDFTQNPRIIVSRLEITPASLHLWFANHKGDNYLPGYEPSMPNFALEEGQKLYHEDIWVEEEEANGYSVYNASAISIAPNTQRTDPDSHGFGLGKLLFIRRMPNTRLPHKVLALNEVKGDHRVRSRPWYWSIVNHISHLNLSRSLMIDGLELQIRPPITTNPGTDDVTWTLKPGQLGAATVIPLKRGRIVEYMQTQTHAIEAESTIIAGIERELNMLMPPEVRGQIPSANTTGYLFSQISALVDNTQAQLDTGLSSLIESTFQEVLHQMTHLPKGAAISVDAKEKSGENQGHYYYEAFKVADMAHTPVINVRLAPRIPKDDIATVQVYTAAVQSGMYDEDTARSNIAGIEHPTDVRRKVQMDQVRNSDQAKISFLLRTMRQELAEAQALAENEDDRARKIPLLRTAFILEGELSAFETQLLGQAQKQLGRPAPGQAGPSPQVLPPEAQGPVVSPDEEGGRSGTPPNRSSGRNPGPNRSRTARGGV